MSETIQVSMVADAYATETKPVQLLSLLQEIKDGRWKFQQDVIRKKREKKLRETGGDLKAAKLEIKRKKEALPGVTFAGSFSYRTNDHWTVPSGLLPADLDNLNSDLPAVREKLRRSPHVLFDCESVTGSGLRALFRIPIGDKPDEEKYNDCFEAVRQHVLTLCGVEIDPACKDPVRLSFVCADRDARLNLEATPIALLPVSLKAKASTNAAAQYRLEIDKSQVREMLAVIPRRPDYADWIKIVAAVGDALPDDKALEVLNSWSPEKRPDEYAVKLRQRLSDVHIGTLIHLGREYGWTGNLPLVEKPRVQVQSAASANDESTNLTSLSSLGAVEYPNPLKEAAYHGLAGEIVRRIEPHTEADPAALLFQFLTAFGNLIGHDHYIVADGTRHYLILYGVLVGQPQKVERERVGTISRI
jgi:hypothetical protein